MKITKILVCDFETTVFDGQEDTQVWAAACVSINSEDVKIFHSISEQYEFFEEQKQNLICYYHNLKFDGSFWLDYFIIQRKFQQAYVQANKEDVNTIKWLNNSEMPFETIKYSISDMGQWYTITIKTKYNKIIEIRDSLKLLPFSVKRIGESFKTKHKKLDMTYEGLRYPGCTITDEEKEYISNDVLVVKEALEIMFSEGHNKLTIGACCLSEFKKSLKDFDIIRTAEESYNLLFPNLYEYNLTDQFNALTAGDYIRKSYRGGWCYLAKGKENKVFNKGITADVNSLYPSVMSGESGCIYPYGKPTFWSGNFIPDEALKDGRYYFIRIRTRFVIKKGMLPFVQIKGNMLYKPNEMLETSDIYNRKDGKYYSEYYDTKGNKRKAVLEMTLTMTDWKLLKEHYHLVDLEILDGCYFLGQSALFDEYISYYAEMKKTSKGARRELAKLFLNNLYGKMASSTNSSFKVAYIKDDGVLGFFQVTQYDKMPGYIAVGSAITSYAREFTIRAAQKNYYGPDKPGFIYADTDSIHCDLEADQLKGIPVDPVKFCHWKLESSWDFGLFVRQKTYIEHNTHENLEEIENPFYNIKCAGMPERCKSVFLASVEGTTPDFDLTPDEKEFIKEDHKITDFKLGLKVPGKLMPKRIHGGILLVNGFYEMR